MHPLLLVLAFQIAQATAAPSPSPSPLKEIIHLKTTPFCQVFRENIFRAVQGLRINDNVIDNGSSVLAKWAYDSVAENSTVHGHSVEMDRYRLGQVVYEAGHNLQRIYDALNDPVRFPKDPQSDGDRNLAAMKAQLEAVADAQERSLNILSGTYETAALDYLLSLGDNTAGALGQVSVKGKSLELGDPIFPVPGVSPPPTSASVVPGSLFAMTPVGQIHTAVKVTQQITGQLEDRAGDAIGPGVNRCRDQ